MIFKESVARSFYAGVKKIEQEAAEGTEKAASESESAEPPPAEAAAETEPAAEEAAKAE